MHFLFNEDGSYCAHRKTKFNATEIPEKTFEVHFKNFNESLYKDLSLLHYDLETKEIIDESVYESISVPLAIPKQNKDDVTIIKDKIANMSVDELKVLFQDIIIQIEDVKKIESQF